MKIALCFKGQPRSFNNSICYNSFFEKIIEPLKTDVYIHTYWDASLVGQFYGTAPYIQQRYKIIPNLEEEIKKIYNPKKIIIDPPINPEPIQAYLNDSFFKKNVFISTKSCWYSMKKVLESIEEEYDWYIITRTDIEIEEFPDLNEENLKFIWNVPNRTFTSISWGDQFKYLFYDVLYLVHKDHLKAFKNLYDDYDFLYKARKNIPNVFNKVNPGLPTSGQGWKWTGGEYLIPFQFEYYGILDRIVKTEKIRSKIIR